MMPFYHVGDNTDIGDWWNPGEDGFDQFLFDSLVRKGKVEFRDSPDTYNITAQLARQALYLQKKYGRPRCRSTA